MIHRTTKKSEHLMRKNPLMPLKQDGTREYMKEHSRPNNWYSWSIRENHRVVLRTADAYANQLNTEKKHSMSGYNTVIYGNNI